MREIKFRGRRIDNGNWVYGQYIRTPLTDENSGTTPDAGWFFLSGIPRHCIAQNGVTFVIDPETVGQLTGLTDRNGKEIYESDIVQHSKGKFTVQWDEDSAMWVLGRKGEWYGLTYLQDYAVIGSIYEHPELLEGP
jgi:uncharacterized phage protein (TIGR01671 family)